MSSWLDHDNGFSCFLIRCNFCGVHVWSSHIIGCPVCECRDIRVLPITGDVRESFEYLRSHGFPYLCERSRVVL